MKIEVQILLSRAINYIGLCWAVLGCTGMHWAVMNCTVRVVRVVQAGRVVHVVKVVM